MTEVAAYLERIGYDGPVDPTIDVLRALHRAHLYAVPFENLDIHLGRPIVLEPELLYRKVVLHRRGGFCYELNGAFSGLLRALGFGVSLLSAGVWAPGRGRFGPPFDHLVLEVTCPGDARRWLADVGFGDGFLEPIRLVTGHESLQDTGVYRLDEGEAGEGGGGEGDLVLRRRTEAGGPFEPLYRFDTRPHDLAEYAEMCRYHQTSPESPFPQRRVCSLVTPRRRLTLRDDRLIVTEDGQRTELPIADDAAYRAALRDHFGIEVSGDWVL